MKKLIPALCMLLVSAVLLGTSTFAWFSMNTQVTATGMQVTAKTNGVFLQIKNADGDSVDATGISAVAKTAAAEIFPAKYNGVPATPDKWQYAYSNSYTDAMGGVVGYNDVAAENVSKYRLVNTFTVYTKDAGTEATNLIVKDYTLTGTSAFIDAIGIVVVCGDKIQHITASDVTSGTAVDISSTSEVLASTVNNTGVEVSVYVYVHGDNALIKSENASAENLAGISVDLTFSTTAE